MDLLSQAGENLAAICAERGTIPDGTLAIRPLSPDDAVGEKADGEFIIKKGKEQVIEATFEGARGQAFTDTPSEWTGSLRELLDLDLSVVRNRALFVAGLNAVMCSILSAEGTIHCKDEDPTRCGPDIAGSLERRFGPASVGLIGLQPSILKGLAETFGPENVRVVDLNPDNIGATKSGVPVWDDDKDLQRLVDWCEVGLSTGSSVVNGTIDDIIARFERAGKPLVFFGNTISGVAALLCLDRLCPFAGNG